MKILICSTLRYKVLRAAHHYSPSHSINQTPRLYGSEFDSCLETNNSDLITSSETNQRAVSSANTNPNISNGQTKAHHEDLRQALENLRSQVSFTIVPKRRLTCLPLSLPFDDDADNALRTSNSKFPSSSLRLRSQIPNADPLRRRRSA